MAEIRSRHRPQKPDAVYNDLKELAIARSRVNHSRMAKPGDYGLLAVAGTREPSWPMYHIKKLYVKDEMAGVPG